MKTAITVIIGIIGFLAAGSDGKWFPLLNFVGLAVFGLCAWAHGRKRYGDKEI